MNPFFNPNQIQNNGAIASAPHQVMSSSNFQGNPSNIMPNNGQIQPQMGIINPQMSVPFNSSNTHLGNGNMSMPNGSIQMPSPCFMNAPNQISPLQNNGMHFLGPHNSNSFAMNQLNSSQLPGQLFVQNSGNPGQFFNPNVGFPNGQFFMQSPMQNMNQFVQMHTPYNSQVVPGSLPLCPNGVSQAIRPQNPIFGANPQFGLVQSNGFLQPNNQAQHNLMPPTVNGNASKQLHNSTQQLQGRPPLPLGSGPLQPQQAQNNFRPVLAQSQANPRKDIGFNKFNNNRKNSQKRSFTKNSNHDASHSGFMKSQFHHAQNARGKFRPHNGNGVKGCGSEGLINSGLPSSTNQTRVEKKRSLSLNYTEQEIQQWREQRRKNYPSNTNTGKKLAEPEVTDSNSKLWRQQLKEVLAKQAELGFEVAEIPPCYLLDSEQQGHGREQNKRPMGKKESFQNKFNKRGRFQRNDRFAQKQKAGDHDSPNLQDQNNRLTKRQRFANNDSVASPAVKNKEPTLLQKLLSSDIRREKSHLLQVFRFMVLNSFFKDWPDMPLRFPLVVVRETGVEVDAIEEKSPQVVKCDFEGNDNGNEETDTKVQRAAKPNYVFGKGTIGEYSEGPEEEGEEGEITD